MSLALIQRFGNPHNVLRDTNKEVRIKGKRSPDVWETISIILSVQPLKPDETIEASNERNTQGIKIYSFDELKSVDVNGQFKADRVEYLGDIFEVIRVDKYLDNKRKLVHYRSQALKINIERDK